MRYQCAEWIVDREAGLLTRHGQPVNVTRKILDCIDHLIRNRDRVVGYDELIYKIWGHGDVHNQRLARVVLDARKLLRDDGHSQHYIRTANGLGYQWVKSTIEVENTAEPASARPQTLAVETLHFAATGYTALRSRPPAAAPEAAADLHDSAAITADDKKANPGTRSHVRRTVLALTLLVLLGLLAFRIEPTDSTIGSISPSQQTPPDSLQTLDDALRAGEFDKVRVGLSVLPHSKAQSPDGMLIAMRLDMYRGRLQRAREKLDQQQALAREAADPIWQAKLLVFEVLLQGRSNTTAASRLKTAQAAIDLLEHLPKDAAPEILAEALRLRALTYDDMGKYEETMRDLNSSSEIYERIADTRGLYTIRSERARIWVRYGRVEDALQVMPTLADYHLRMKNNTTALTALAEMARMEMELLRTSEALETSERALNLINEMPDSDRRRGTALIHAQVLTRMGRLREARAQLEYYDAIKDDKMDAMIRVMYLLEAGDDAAALHASNEAFVESNWEDLGNILLTTREGALLTWTIAANRLVEADGALPVPSPMQQDALGNPQTTAGIIASARWAAINNDGARAEALLREALFEARQKGLRYHMVLAAEPLFDLLLAQGRKVEAKRLLNDVRAFDQERFDADFHFMRLRWRLAVAANDTPQARELFEKLTALAGERPIVESHVSAKPRQ